MKKNNLPKYWIVKGDNSELFQDTVIKCLEEDYGEPWSGYSEWYFGYDNSYNYNGTNTYSMIEDFINNPVLLTLDKLIQLYKGSSDNYTIY